MTPKPCPLLCQCARHSGEYQSRAKLQYWAERRRELGTTWREFVNGERHFIYYLLDPRTREVRWIGASSDPWKRFLNHCTVVNTNVRHLSWIRDLRPLRPILVVKCILPSRQEAEKLEERLYHKLQGKGYDLLNILPAQRRG